MSEVHGRGNGDERDCMLRISDLRVSFSTEAGLVPAVGGVDLQVHVGETLAIVGESGSGKSTVALSVMGLLPGSANVSGSMNVDGHELSDCSERQMNEFRGSLMSIVFQEPATALNPLMRVGEQIAWTIRNHDAKVDSKEALERAEGLLEQVGIPNPRERMKSYPFEMSGGQRQRVVIAMAIANRPKLLIADEPTTALDVTVQAEILDVLRELSKRNSMAVLFITHNMGVVADAADSVAVMHHGTIVESGSVDDVLLHPQHSYTRLLLSAVPRLRVEGESEVEGKDSSRTSVVDRPDGSIVQADHMEITFGKGKQAVRALQDVNITVGESETVGLVGESGSGKSTAARAILGLHALNGGSIRLFEHDTAKLRGRAKRHLRASVGVVLQDPVASLDSRMSVFRCISEPLDVHMRLSRHEKRAMVAEMVDAVQLPSTVLDRAPRELSGGQRQRVSIARALILKPKLLVADEPTSALDVSVQQIVLDLLGSLRDDLHFSCLFISHDLAVVQQMTQRVYVMKSGRIVESGRTQSTLSHPKTDYTRKLLDAVPVANPIVQRQRRERMAR
ncbi:dipeptide ABC transporter ATP-binding protein [Bifidobacterium sp.]|uniref:dipeptide ABC transporter ATP-binding protein n=1 Tax=Bifidobacterium sp. TaxID=41200 RepID=UPI0039E9854A